jgi:WD40 repeat protein
MNRLRTANRVYLITSIFCLMFASTFASAKGGNVAQKVAEFKEDDDVASLEFSADSNQIAVGTFVTLHIHIWKWASRSHIEQTFSKPPVVLDYTSSDGIRYSADGRFLAVAHGRAPEIDGSGVVRIFDANSGAVVDGLAEPLGGGIYSRIAFSGDGKFLVRSYDSDKPPGRNQLMVYSADTWEELWGLRVSPLNVMALALSANSTMAAVGGVTLGPGITHNAQILIVDLTQKRVTRTIDDAFPRENHVTAIAWHPDGVHLAAGGTTGGTFSGTDAVRIYDTSTGKLVSQESASPASISALRYTPNGKYLIECGIGSSVRIWDGTHQILVQELSNRHANALAVSRDSSYLAVSDGPRVEVWKFR